MRSQRKKILLKHQNAAYMYMDTCMQSWQRLIVIITSHIHAQALIHQSWSALVYLVYFQDACQLTLDPNTTYRQLYLSRNNRKAALKKDPQSYNDSNQRFDCLPQVLCKEALSEGAFYWEVEWSGEGASIGVAFKGIKRTGYGDSARIGYNRKSWSLFCSDSSYSARHHKDQVEINAPYCSRIGVFLDCAGGTLSFYTVSESMSLIHQFKASFSEPVYPGFWVWYESAITICQL